MDGCVFSYNGCRIKRTVSPKEQEKLPGETRVTPLVDAEAVLGSMYLAFADILNELFLLLGFLLFFLEALFLRLILLTRTLAAVMNLISLDTVLEHLDRYRARQRVRRCGVLVLQTLVNLEEMRDLVAVMRRQLVDIMIIVPVRILERNGDDLIVDLIIINHADHADRIAVHLDHRVKRFTAQHEHIQRIAVTRISARNKAVIGRIMR